MAVFVVPKLDAKREVIGVPGQSKKERSRNKVNCDVCFSRYSHQATLVLDVFLRGGRLIPGRKAETTVTRNLDLGGGPRTSLLGPSLFATTLARLAPLPASVAKGPSGFSPL